MEVTWLVVGGVSLLIALTSLVLLVSARRDLARAERDGAAARAESARLERRVEELAHRVDLWERSPADQAPVESAYVITDAGQASPSHVPPATADRLVLSAALGEPLVRAAALSHGVRRALSAESRHRIRFAMRQESKRVRKQRRREMREVWLAHKRSERSKLDGVSTADEAVSAA